MSEDREKKVIFVKKQTQNHRTCLNCGKVIDHMNKKAKYCSKACWLAQSKYADNPLGGSGIYAYNQYLKL